MLERNWGTSKPAHSSFKSVSVSGFWTFLYFVSFCFLANQWSQTTPDELPLNQGADAARAAIAFSFFSIITWVRSQICLSSLKRRKSAKLKVCLFLSDSHNKTFSLFFCFNPPNPPSSGWSDCACSPEVPAGHRHVTVHHGAPGRRRAHPAIPFQFTCRGHHRDHRDLPEPALHR